jgi:hypothetical protein
VPLASGTLSGKRQAIPLMWPEAGSTAFFLGPKGTTESQARRTKKEQARLGDWSLGRSHLFVERIHQ